MLAQHVQAVGAVTGTWTRRPGTGSSRGEACIAGHIHRQLLHRLHLLQYVEKVRAREEAWGMAAQEASSRVRGCCY